MVDIESIMEMICDNCHWPYVCGEDELEERCAKCAVEREIRKTKDLHSDRMRL